MPHNNVRSTCFGSSDTSLSARFTEVLKKVTHLKQAIFCERDLTNLLLFNKIINTSHIRDLIRNPIFCCV